MQVSTNLPHKVRGLALTALLTSTLLLLPVGPQLSCLSELIPAGVRSAQAGGATGPRFTWSSFLFFWNKHTSPEVMLRDPKPVNAGYLSDFGQTVSVLVMTNKAGGVVGARVRYVGGRGYDAGGPKFLKLVQHAIDVGSYRWPDDIIAEAREHFRVMTKVTKDFRYQNTHFRMEYSEQQGWVFSMLYL